MDKRLLTILRCPVTHKGLSVLKKDKLDKINRGSSDKKIEDLAFKLTSMEESISRRIEDDLSANVEKVDKMSERL